jgi:hypothetical protein
MASTLSPASIFDFALMDTFLVDEFAMLDFEIQSFKPKIQRHAELRATILAACPDLPPEQSRTVPGRQYSVVVTPCDQQRVITLAGLTKLRKEWGVPTFMRRIALALKHLPDPKDPGNLYTMQSRTGARHLRPVPKAQPLAA